MGAFHVLRFCRSSVKLEGIGAEVGRMMFWGCWHSRREDVFAVFAKMGGCPEFKQNQLLMSVDKRDACAPSSIML